MELFSILVQDPEFGEQNRKLFVSWADTHGQLAKVAAANLQPIWSQPRVKAAQYADSFDAARNRMRAIAAEIGFDARAIIDG